MYLIFDTETTGVPHNKSAPLTDLDNWPRVVQIAWQLHDPKGNLLSQKSYIVRPEGFDIPYKAEQVHGITTQRALKEGHPLADVLKSEFREDLAKTSVLVGQNIEFDINILSAKFIRQALPPDALLEAKKMDTGLVVTVRQLLTMTSGVKWNEDYEDKNSDVNRFNFVEQKGMDATISYLRTLPRAHEAGNVWNYNTGETNLIGVLVSSATKKQLSQYLHEKIWQPFGMENDATWLLGPSGHEIAGCCIQAATRDFARFGLFVLANGNANAKQIVPHDWFSQAIKKQQDIREKGRGYGFQSWTYDDGSVSARGIFGQGIFIDPNRNLIIATNSSWATRKPWPAK